LQRLLFPLVFAAALNVLAWPPAVAAEPPLRIAAAVSLKEALDETAAAFRKATGGDVAVTYAASSALARQIEAKAPFDVFISADADWMDYLAARQLVVPGTRRNLLGNGLVLIGRKDGGSESGLRIGHGFPLAGALKGGRLAIANPDAVPAGRYAKAALEHLGVWTSIERATARAENVRVALAYVARGEAPLGIVYRTDALAEPGVRVIDTFPAAAHPPIVYPVAVLRDGAAPAGAAKRFAAFLGGDSATAIWKRHGFAVPPE
jgi:molybdate transport system substrate-binding protein